MTRLRRFLHLDRVEQRVLVRAVIWLALMRLGLWVLPLRTVRRLAVPRLRPRTGLRADRILWAVDTASRHLPGGATCLPRSLAALSLLRAAGHSAQLRLGVRRADDGQVQGHAWVESDDGLVFGADKVTYTPISLPGEAMT